MMYYVNWVLTTAQLELIAADVSVVDYNYGKDRKMKKGDYDNTPADAEKVRKAARQWTERYGDGKDAGTGLSIGDILSGGMKADVGVKIDG
jgi:ribosomal protein L13E